MALADRIKNWVKFIKFFDVKNFDEGVNNE